MNPKPWGPRQPFWGEIKQIQVLMTLLSCIPPDGKLREVVQMALDVPGDAAMDGTTICEDVTTNGLRDWFSSMWSRDDLGAEHRELVEWQLDGENMKSAVKELMEVEDHIGLMLGVVRKG